MKVSKIQLESYDILESNYFTSRTARNTNLPNPVPGTYCAIAAPGADITDENAPIWDLEQYNGVNWVLISIDPSFALVVTNDGLKAVSNAQIGGYMLKLSRVVLRQNNISSGGKPITSWVSADFIDGSQILDTLQSDSVNPSFSMSHNIGYRINMANGGIQYSILLDVDTFGYSIESGLITNYNVGAIGLFIIDPQLNTEVLFAVGNISSPIAKYATTPNRVGNSLKLYLNTTLSNLGYVSDLTVVPENVRGIPEVVTEEDLRTTWDGISTPHNIILIDNLHGSNIPALAVRTGDPVVNQDINWVYFTPSDDSILITNPDLVDPSLKDYMAAAYNGNKYVPADGDSELLKTQGIKVGQSIIYAGTIRNLNSPLVYSMILDDAGGTGQGYHVGDRLSYRYTDDENSIDITFDITITKVGNLGQVQQYTFNPKTGNKPVDTVSAVAPDYKPGSEYRDGLGFKVKIQSTDNSTRAIAWDFPAEWLNKPLYVDTTPNEGKLTINETETFAGWCTGTNSIKLALDLRNEASETNYGTTRYATNVEVSDVTNNPDAKDKTTITPSKAQANYLQKTIVAGNPGDTFNNPIQIDTYTKFNQTIVGKGVSDITDLPNQNISFFGLAYRAWWGDLAEFYRSDKPYQPGTLITIGDGFEEITVAKVECNGIISTNPGYELGNKESDLDLPVALVGKVPVRFAKDCVPNFGDRIYLSKIEQGCASTIPNGKCLGKIIDKRKDLSRIKDTILCSVRISF